MNKRWVKSIISVVFALFCVSAVSAKSLSIQIIQNNPGQDKIWAASYLFEQDITDYFFDSGDIVSSSPIWISDTEDKNRSALRASLQENREGGMEVLVRVEVFYDVKNSSNPDGLLLDNIKNVEWKAYSVASGAEIFNGRAEPERVDGKNNNESGLSQFAGFVAYKINTQMKYR